MQGCASKSEADAIPAADRAAAVDAERRRRGPVPVVVATVMQKDVPINIDVIGNVEAYSTISVKAQVGGQLTKVYFQEGDYVKKGDLLFTIDPRPTRPSSARRRLSSARPKPTRRAITPRSARRRPIWRATPPIRSTLETGRPLREVVRARIVSREQTDQMRASADALMQTMQADKAAIESARAQIGADKASVANVEAMIDNAKVQLGYTAIRSPIDGRTGNLAVKQGNMVTANTMELMTITQVQPIYVTFSVPEAQLGDIKKYMARRQAAGAGPVRRTTGDHRGNRRADVHRQRRGCHHRHHQAQRHFPE